MIVRSLLSLIIASAALIGAISPARAAEPIFEASYLGTSLWKINKINQRVACIRPQYDASRALRVGDVRSPLTSDVKIPLFFGAGACGIAIPTDPAKIRAPFSFVAVMVPRPGIPGTISLSDNVNGQPVGLLSIIVNEDGITVRRTFRDLCCSSLISHGMFDFVPWDFDFRPLAVDGNGAVIVVASIQVDGKLRIDVRDGSTGRWVGKLIDGGWPYFGGVSTPYLPFVPTAIQPDLDGFPSTFSYFAIYDHAIMTTVGGTAGDPVVNAMSGELYEIIRQWSLVDTDNKTPETRYLPCNTGHWLPERAEKTYLGPKAPGKLLCKIK